MTEDEILDDLIRREGSVYTNYPDDKGGPTRFGVTLATLREERGPAMRASDVALLSESDARDIYRRRYIRRPGFDMVKDDRLRAFLVDYGVNAGPKRAVVALQRAIGASPDGIIGTETVRLLEGKDGPRTYAVVLRARLRLYVDIVLADRTQLVFLRGWMNRLGEFF